MSQQIPFLQLFAKLNTDPHVAGIVENWMVTKASIDKEKRTASVFVIGQNGFADVDLVQNFICRQYALSSVSITLDGNEETAVSSAAIQNEKKPAASRSQEHEDSAAQAFARTEEIRRAALAQLPQVKSSQGSKNAAKTENKIIFGKPSRKEAIAMSALELDMGSVAVEGVVFKISHRELKKRKAWIVSFEMTDYTSSVKVNKFFNGEEGMPIISGVKKGMCVRVQGKLTVDHFTGETVLEPYAVSQVPRTLREDKAAEKRVELHLHTTMSSMDALTSVSPKQGPETNVIKRAQQWGHRAIAITDHGVAQSFPDAWHSAKDIKILYGVEAYFINNVNDWVKKEQEEDESFTEKGRKRRRLRHLIILAKDQWGLRNLYKLVSLSHLEHFKRVPIMAKSLIEENREGLILGSACEAGELFSAIVANRSWDELLEIASWYDFLEIQPICNNYFMLRKGVVDSVEQLKEFNRTIVKLGQELKIPVCATGDVHFLDPEDEIYRHILLASKKFDDADEALPIYFKTTEEMLEEFSYLGEETAHEVVIKNTNFIADCCEPIKPLPKGLFPPSLENSRQELENLVWGKAHTLYGDTLPQIVQERIDVELNDIITCNYDVIYMSAQKLVQDSLDNGYLVGSRGSVGSSLVAFLSGITEVNSLPAHYRCPSCKHSDFQYAKDHDFGCGADMPDAVCPICGAKYEKDGFHIPFETFLGFGGDKVPDIDLNFSGEYQANAHKYTFKLFGENHVFRAGTVGTVAEKTAFGFVKKYLEEQGRIVSRAEENRLTDGCSGVKRTTGQHPGGMVVIPQDKEIYDFCPIQHPADDIHSDIITTHFEYHSMEDNLLKLDILGHDDPSMIRMLQDLTGQDPQKIKLDDPQTMSLFCSSKALGYENDPILGQTGAVAIPEFGTSFVRGMLMDTQPTQFDTLVRLSGFSHGTDVWLGNAKDLITSGTATVRQAIGCRDDIMIYLISMGMDEKRAFKIMEAVRKGRGLPDGAEDEMKQLNVPQWYIDSCKKIAYLFPKAHAVAYVMMAFRIAWFKVHQPLAFYAAYFSIRAKAFDEQFMCRGMDVCKQKIRQIIAKDKDATNVELDMLTTLEVCYEFYLRGFSFQPISLYRSHASRFIPDFEKGTLLPPFTSVAGLGEAAAQSVLDARENTTFVSIEEISASTKLSKTHIEQLKDAKAFGDLPQTSQLDLFSMF